PDAPGARTGRRGRRNRARDRFQPGQRLLREPAASLLAGRDPAEALAGRGAVRLHGERRARSRPCRPDRPARTRLCGGRRPARRSRLALPRVSPRRRRRGGRRRRGHTGRVTLGAMPTKKQRRRQQKSRRHEYEYVYVDDEGNEVAVDPTEPRTEKNGDRAESRPSKAAKRPSASGRTARRAIEPPSWRRSGRRALLLGPILVVAMM